MGKPHDDATRAAISESIRLHHLLRTPEQKAITSQKNSDAAVCKMWISKGPRYGRQPGSKNKLDSKTRIANTTLAKIREASIKKIIKDLANTRPELFENAIIEGLEAPPPRSYPYVALCAAYLDGKPIDAEPRNDPQPDLSDMTTEQLIERAFHIGRSLQAQADEREARGVGLDVIDAEVISPEQLQDEIRKAELEVRLANEEAERANAVLRIARMGKK